MCDNLVNKNLHNFNVPGGSGFAMDHKHKFSYGFVLMQILCAEKESALGIRNAGFLKFKVTLDEQSTPHNQCT